jgi:hypothetical protein
MFNKIEAYNKLRKELEEEIRTGIQTIFFDVIPTAEIHTVFDTLEKKIMVEVMMLHEINRTTISVTENLFTYHLDDPDNLTFQGSTRISVYKQGLTKGAGGYDKHNLYSIATTNSEIDLRTLVSLKQKIKDYCITKNIVENPVSVEDFMDTVHMMKEIL